VIRDARLVNRDSRADSPALVLQTSFIGDVVLTTPLIAHLATRGPVDVVTTPASAGLLANNPGIRRLIAYDKRGGDRGLAGLRRVAGQVRAETRDAVAYCVQGSWRTAALAVAAGFSTRVGFDTSHGRWLYTIRVPYRRDRHHAERILRLAQPGLVEVSGDPPRPDLHPGAAERDAVDALLREAHFAGEPLIGLAPGSIWATKRWPYFAGLARLLSARGRIVVVGSSADRAPADEILAATNGAAIDAVGRLTLLASTELIRRCGLLVTNDSAPQHLASAMGTRTLTVFGPTVPGFGFGPLAPRSGTAGHPALPCRPCHPHGPPVCPLGHWRCMRDLTAETVAGLALDPVAPTA
jgi:heptosyltransferase-2